MALWVIGRAPADDGRALQMTPGPYRQIPFPKRLQGPAVTYRIAVIMEDGRPARPSLPTLPGTVGNTAIKSSITNAQTRRKENFSALTLATPLYSIAHNFLNIRLAH